MLKPFIETDRVTLYHGDALEVLRELPGQSVHSSSRDSRSKPIGMEQEPGSSGVDIIDHYRRNVLKGYVFKGDRATGSKVSRAAAMASAAEAGNVVLLRRPWNETYLDELEGFTGDDKLNDDQVDAGSGAFNYLATTDKTLHV